VARGGVRRVVRTSVIAVLFVCTVAPPVLASRLREAAPSRRPNILFIITDDQRRDGGMVVQPRTLRIFRGAGTEFTRFHVTTPLCCPSRGTFWSGRYAHNHGVLVNGDRRAERGFDHRRAIASVLRRHGYRTGMAGKFWTGWPLDERPPGYDRWANMSGDYRGGRWNVDGDTGGVQGYSTNLIGEFATDQLRDFEAQDAQPWFLYVSPLASHTPFIAAPRDAHAPLPRWAGNRAAREQDRSDKPPYMRSCCSSGLPAGRRTRAQQLRTLMSVDDLVGRLFGELRRLGETRETLAIYTSDNGYMWAEHGRIGKRAPYEASYQVPFLLRWPGHVRAGATDPRLTANIDVAPTIYEAAGIDPAWSLDGSSLLGTGHRNRLLLEYFQSPDDPFPPWAATLTRTHRYTEWYDPVTGKIRFREYYDLAHDPWELENLLHDGRPGNDPEVARLHRRLLRDRRCAGARCPRLVT
jgi:arylsulfatase A-like enzyme